jgi:hypothetical protein
MQFLTFFHLYKKIRRKNKKKSLSQTTFLYGMVSFIKNSRIFVAEKPKSSLL